MAARQMRVRTRGLMEQRRDPSAAWRSRHRGGRSTARSAAPEAIAPTRCRPFTSNQRSFLWPAHTCPTQTAPRAPPSNRTSTVARSSLWTLNASPASSARANASLLIRRLEPRSHHRAEIGEHRFDAAGRRRAGRDRTSASRCRQSPSSCRLSPARDARRSRWAAAASPADTRRERSAARRSRRRESSRAPAARADCRGN